MSTDSYSPLPGSSHNLNNQNPACITTEAINVSTQFMLPMYTADVRVAACQSWCELGIRFPHSIMEQEEYARLQEYLKDPVLTLEILQFLVASLAEHERSLCGSTMFSYFGADLSIHPVISFYNRGSTCAAEAGRHRFSQ